MPASSSTQSRLPYAWRSWLSSTALALATAALLTVVLGWFGLAQINRLSRGELEARLNSEVETSVLALQMWLDEQRSVVESWAGKAGVRTEIADVANSPPVRNWNRDSVLGSDELRRLRTRLAPVCKAHGYVGFVVMDLEGQQIAGLLDDAVGDSLKATPYETVRRTLQGETVVTHPFVSSIPLPDERAVHRSSSPRCSCPFP